MYHRETEKAVNNQKATSVI